MLRKIAFTAVLGLSYAFGVQFAWAAEPNTYLALGDSVAFGYTPLGPLGDLSQYYGYPQIVAGNLNRTLANASCFGETSTHFLNLAAEDLGCAGWRSALPLFVSYSGTQMDYAVQHLLTHPQTNLVTIDIGINDLGVLLRDCNGDIPCAQSGAPAVFLQYQADLVAIYSAIRGTGYTGPIVAVTAYAFNYSDPLVTPAIATLNTILTGVTTAFGGQIADAFTTFGAAALPHGGDVCKTGLLAKLKDPNNQRDHPCDTHPSDKGQKLLAELVMQTLTGRKK